MARPQEETLKSLRDRLATRLGFGGMTSAAINKQLLNSFLQDAQRELFERIGMNQLKAEVYAYSGPGEQRIEYPDGIDPDRIRVITIDYSGQDDWYPMHEGIEWDHDSTQELSSFPRRFEFFEDHIALWPVSDSSYSIALDGTSALGPTLGVFPVEATDLPRADMWVRLVSEDAGFVEVTHDLVVQSASGGVIQLVARPGATLTYNSLTPRRLEVGYRYKLDGYAELAPFENDADRATLPSNLLFLQAVADAKAHYDHKDATIWQQRAVAQLKRFRGREHGMRRYIPPGVRRRLRRELVRPKLVD